MTGRVSIWRSIYRLIVDIIAVHEKMKIKIAKGYNLKLHIQNIHENIFAKAFNLKVQKQNVHEIEKIMNMIGTWRIYKIQM